MEPEYIKIYGDLAARASLLFSRLERNTYHPENIFDVDQDWPGDWPGRTILALVSLARITKKVPAWLDDIVTAVLDGRNERGYIGHILPENEFDEQQMSGHGWLLRGLIAYWRYTERRDILNAAVTVGENLFLPASDAYADYPDKPDERVNEGGAVGSIAKTVRGWHISTDTGCAFIALDGMSELYEVTRDERFGRLCEIMAESFLKIDFLSICAQTHATLTATRGLLRLYRITGKVMYLTEAERIFRLYTEYGMTANYANFNWFGRPEWTEPCAITDSYICAMNLYCFTGDRKYITLAQRIYFNGLGFGQRENGGFGCDTCLGAAGKENSDIISVSIPEAYWCCTMRGAEALREIAENSYLVNGSTVTIPCFVSSGLETENLKIVQRTRYPYENSVSLKIIASEPVTVKMYLPDKAKNIECSHDSELSDGFVIIHAEAGESEISLSFETPVSAELTEGAGLVNDRYIIVKGNMMLSAPKDFGSFISPETDDMTGFRPLFDAYETDHESRKALFRLK